MHAFLNTLALTLGRASSFTSDWYGWVTNQSGHAMIIGVPLGLLLMLMVDPVIAVVVGHVLYFTIFERGLQGGDDLRDSWEDAYHVGAGIALTALPITYVPVALRHELIWVMLASYAIWMVTLYFGVRRRL